MKYFLILSLLLTILSCSQVQDEVIEKSINLPNSNFDDPAKETLLNFYIYGNDVYLNESHFCTVKGLREIAEGGMEALDIHVDPEIATTYYNLKYEIDLVIDSICIAHNVAPRENGFNSPGKKEKRELKGSKKRTSNAHRRVFIRENLKDVSLYAPKTTPIVDILILRALLMECGFHSVHFVTTQRYKKRVTKHTEYIYIRSRVQNMSLSPLWQYFASTVTTGKDEPEKDEPLEIPLWNCVIMPRGESSKALDLPSLYSELFKRSPGLHGHDFFYSKISDTSHVQFRRDEYRWWNTIGVLKSGEEINVSRISNDNGLETFVTCHENLRALYKQTYNPNPTYKEKVTIALTFDRNYKIEKCDILFTTMSNAAFQRSIVEEFMHMGGICGRSGKPWGVIFTMWF